MILFQGAKRMPDIELPFEQSIHVQFIFLDFYRRGSESQLAQTQKKVEAKFSHVTGTSSPLETFNPFLGVCRAYLIQIV